MTDRVQNAPADFHEQLRRLEERGLRLRPVDAVDRGGVVARDHQQALDAGRLRRLGLSHARCELR